MKIFHWSPVDESGKAPKQIQKCQILTSIWSDLDQENAQKAAMQMGGELIDDIVKGKYSLENIKDMKAKKEKCLKSAEVADPETAEHRPKVFGHKNGSPPEAGATGTSTTEGPSLGYQNPRTARPNPNTGPGPPPRKRRSTRPRRPR